MYLLAAAGMQNGGSGVARLWSAKSFDFLEVELITAIIHLDYDESSRHCWA